MSKSELKEEKKRKRQEEGAEEVPKKSKKSKKVKDVAAEEASLDEVAKKEKKDKKAKKSKKGGNETEANNAIEPEQDFIKLEGGDEPATGVQNGTISRKDSKKSKKDKKEKKEKKSKKTGEVADAMDVDVPADAPVEEAEPAAELSKEEKKKAKKEKKEKKSNKSEEDAEADSMEVDAPAEVKSSKKDKKSKKEKKEKKTEAEQDTTAAAEEPATNGDVEQDLEVQEEEATGKKSRFIVFVGNLPFSATKETIEAHFAKLKPFEIRMRFYKDNKKFMGTCFIEFERFDHMQTALTKYHHSVFPDEKLKDGRKINVELSAGGGGNTPARQEKIKAKNEKLANERIRIRERRDEIESKQKERKEKKEARGIKTTDGAGDEPEAEAKVEDENTGIHPARLAMMQETPKPWQQNGRGGGYGGGRGGRGGKPWQQNHRQRF